MSTEPEKTRVLPTSTVNTIIAGIFALVVALAGGTVYVYINNIEPMADNSLRTQIALEATQTALEPTRILDGVGATQTSIVLTQTKIAETPSVPATAVPATAVPVTAVPATAVPATAVPATLNPPTGVTQAQLNTLFGLGNWFCMPDRNDIIGVKSLPTNFLVQSPIIRIDNPDGVYRDQQVVPGNWGSSVYLQEALQASECPVSQQAELERWKQSQPITITKSYLDSKFGQGNWTCSNDMSYLIIVSNLATNLYIEHPITNVDKGFFKYGVGETVPSSGRASIWTQDVPRDQCT
jgi:hypothetical protein